MRRMAAILPVLLIVAVAAVTAYAQDLDVLIDGNGEGIYGDPGTGAGGSSTRIGAQGSTVSFTLEIRNQGSLKNKYKITWNTIPGWTATVNGSPSPFVSPNIPAGESYFCTFQVTVPPDAVLGDYEYIIDVKEVKFRIKEWESVTAVVSVPDLSQPDLVVDGDGLGVVSPAGSGGGGGSTRICDPGASFVSTLRIWNTGTVADSFEVFWEDPVGWPAGSVVVVDGAGTHLSPFVTPVVAPGAYIDYTVQVSVPGNVPPEPARIVMNARAHLASRREDSILLEVVSYAVVSGTVFDDVNHDLIFSSGDRPMEGVVVREETAGLSVASGADGGFTFRVPGGSAPVIIEENPSGYLSLTPDTLSLPALGAGDTVSVDFADVAPLYLSPGTMLEGLSGAYVDFPHELRAGTQGQVTLSADAGGAVTMIMLDADGDGKFSAGDRLLDPSDTYMDPVSGRSVVRILLRVFIPVPMEPGEMLDVSLSAVQEIEGTPYTFSEAATDVVLVVGSSVGRLRLEKDVDASAARPGEVLTYTIRYFNAGTDTVQEVVLLDPVSVAVDPVVDAFGPGMDVRWTDDGGAVRYLTIDPGDGDECDFYAGERVMRITFSKVSPFYVPPGLGGSIEYKVLIK